MIKVSSINTLIAAPLSFLSDIYVISQLIGTWIVNYYISIQNIFIKPIVVPIPDPFSLPPPFDITSPIPPIRYVPPNNGYTIITNTATQSIQVVNGVMYYVVPSSTLMTSTLSVKILSLTEKASLGTTLNPWTPILNSYFGEIVTTTAKYSVISGSIVILNFDFLLKNLQNITVDSSITINLPILAKGNDKFESALTAEVNYGDYALGDYAASYMQGRVLATGSKLIFYMYSFQPNMTYRLRGQINYRLEDNENI
jgi:hypothetical protein